MIVGARSLPYTALIWSMSWKTETSWMPCSGRGERRELAQRSDVGALVENEEQRRIDRLPGLRRMLVGTGDDLLDKRREEWLEAALLVRGRAEIGGVTTAVEEA